jgi:hypothetical protein
VSHQAPKAKRILTIDEEIAVLERSSPRSWLSDSALIPLGVMLGALGAFLINSAGYRLRVLSLWPVLLLVAVPSALYGLELFKNWRRRMRLERELDELVADSGAGKPGSAFVGGRS